MRNLKAIAALAVLAVVAWIIWSQYSLRKNAEKRTEIAEHQLGLDAARLINAKFESSAELKVSTLAGKGVGKAEFEGTIFRPTQVTSAPVSVDYFLDLRKVRPGSFRWNEKTNTLSIDLPDVTVGKINIDMSAAEIKQSGTFISREAGVAMNRISLDNIKKKVEAEAKTPERMARARDNARTAIIAFARNTLRAANISGASIAVSFPWEPKTGSSLADHWDVTRSIPEVLADQK